MYGKAQIVRLVDVVLLGPFLIYYALASMDTFPPLQVALLFVSGVATILYNGYNYLEISPVW